MDNTQTQQGIKEYLTNNQYAPSPIQAHTHNGSDSLRVSFNNLADKVPTALLYSPPTLVASGIATLHLQTSNQHFITMPAGNITIAIAGDMLNQIFIISITQDSVGSRTVTWFSTIRWSGGSPPVLTTTANKRDTFGFIRTGTGTYDGFIVGQNI